MEREKVKITNVEEFGDITGYGPWHWEEQVYEKVEINYQQNCDGECWDTIVKRESDGKYFKFHVWDAGHHNGYIFCSDSNNSGTMEEVFPKQIITVEYE